MLNTKTLSGSLYDDVGRWNYFVSKEDLLTGVKKIKRFGPSHAHEDKQVQMEKKKLKSKSGK